jgi:hypothetical protein
MYLEESGLFPPADAGKAAVAGHFDRGFVLGMRVFHLGFKTALFLMLGLSASFYSQKSAAQVPVYTPPSVAPNEPLAGVRYDRRWEMYGGFAYSHFDAGPNLLEGANLGGFDVQAARFFTRRWAVAANGRGYYGTSATVPNIYGIRGPFVSEHMFLGGPEFRGPSNEHASMTFHAFAGGAYGIFDHALGGVPPSAVGFFNNELTFGAAIGGSIDLNRSPKLALRISPDATLTNFGSSGIKEQFAISVGIIYRLGKPSLK